MEAEDLKAEHDAVRKVEGQWKGSQPFSLESHTKDALFFLGGDNWLRKFCFSIVDDKRFDWLMMLLIFGSSIAISIETPWMVCIPVPLFEVVVV